MPSKTYCPHCNVSLQGAKIPDDIAPMYHPVTHWGREIGMEYPDKYDGVWEWMCPDCEGTWPSSIQRLRNNEKKRIAR